MIEFIQEHEQSIATIKVIGVGGAGSNTINSMIESGYEAIEFIIANTDAQALRASKASKKIQLGIKSTKGLGSGANPELGRRAAEEDLDKVIDAVGEADIVFLAGGMGGGTGSGALPVIARALKSKGILTVAVVTKPFSFEGKRRARVAEQALEILKKEVDTLIVIPNQKLLNVVDEQVSMIDAFAMINEVLNQSVRGISDIITKSGHINVDFADLREIMRGMGLAVMGTGSASGADRARIAAQQAISSPLLENMSITGAKGVLLNISGGRSLGLHEISQAASIIYEQADEDANIILGSVINEELGDKIVVTIIATGFAQKDLSPVLKPAEVERDIKVKGSAIVDTSLEDLLLSRMSPEMVTVVKEALPLVQPSRQILAETVSVTKEVMVQAVPQPEQKIEAATTPKEEEKSLAFIDADDLDVPTFMRKQRAIQPGE
jgi:cell division protein FtsZ